MYFYIIYVLVKIMIKSDKRVKYVCERICPPVRLKGTVYVKIYQDFLQILTVNKKELTEKTNNSNIHWKKEKYVHRKWV